jgi:hypothetical protein
MNPCRSGAFATLLAVAAVAAFAASTYDVEVKPELNGLPIEIEPQPFDGRLVMKFTNGGDTKVRCDLRYDASPQPIQRSYVYLKPGETAENSFQAKRRWFSVIVTVTCKPSDK